MIKIIRHTIFLIAALFMLNVSGIMAQDISRFGQLRGVVTEVTSGDALIGVNVGIQGTSLGASTNLEGEFAINRIPRGTYLLVATSIGYRRYETEIEIIGGQTLELDIAMEQVVLEGEELVVSVQARGQHQAINEQLTSRQIKNVVSSDRIRELPDDNAATALSRLPGISLMEGDKVVIRGMQAKMNTVMVNGIQMPATGLQDRSTNLGFISSNMLSGIEVTKAVTPDMDANSIGGVVNLRLQEAPEDFKTDFMLQGDYNTQNHTYQNYQMWASVSNRFFNNRLGAFLQGNARRFDGGQNIGNASFEERTPGGDPGYGRAVYGINQFAFHDNVHITEERGGSLILDYKMPSGKLVMQNTYAFTNPDITQHIDELFLASGTRRFRTDRNIHSKHLVINSLQGEHLIGENLGLGIQYGASRAFTKQDTDLMYWIEFVPRELFEDFTTEELIHGTPQDVYNIRYFDDAVLNNTSNNAAIRDEHFTERQLTSHLDISLPFTISSNISVELQSGGRIKQMNRENDVARWFARLSEGNNNRHASDFLVDVVGMEHWNSPLVFSDFRNNSYDRGEYFLGGLYLMNDVVNTHWMDQYMRLAVTGWPRGDNPGGGHIADSRRFDFIADERTSAAYIMGDFSIGSRLSILTGVRYEHFKMDYDAAFMFQNHFDGAGREVLPDEQLEEAGTVFTREIRTTEHWFPNVQLRYNVTSWFDVRLAYTETLVRPDYMQIMPNIFVDGSSNSGVAGNPRLRPTVSQNYDVYLSFYNNRIGLFTVGGFHKRMDDIILPQTILLRDMDFYAESVVWPDPENNLPNLRPRDPVTTFVNNECPNADIILENDPDADISWIPESCHAIVRGVEFDWQTHFWYLPKPFNNMILNVNYTRIFSEMDYRQIINESGPLDPWTGLQEIIVTDTLRTARLIHQGNHIINVALGIDYKGFSGRVSYRMQGDVITSVGSRPEQDRFTGNVHSWDFTLRQRLPVEGLSVFMNGINITHAPTKDYQRFRRGDVDQNIINNESRIAYSPRRFQLGIRYGF